MAAERAQDGVGDVAHARLDGQERPRNLAPSDLPGQEFGDVVTDRLRQAASFR